MKSIRFMDLIKTKTIIKNIYISRILSLSKPILCFLFSSLIDLFIISYISTKFTQIINSRSNQELFTVVLITGLLIFIRTILVYFLKKKSFFMIFKKKNTDESKIINQFINTRVFDYKNNDSIEIFKESLINSSNLAAINFDLPICSILAEIVFAIGGIFIILNLLGIKIVLLNMPIFILLLIFSKFISDNLRKMGRKIINLTEKRLTNIDNISENSYDLSINKLNTSAKSYFNKLNLPFNQSLSSHLSLSSAMQLLTESSSLLVILVTIVSIKYKLLGTDIIATATVLAVLSRMVPSITRTISSITQLQYGIPCIKKLHSICPDLMN